LTKAVNIDLVNKNVLLIEDMLVLFLTYHERNIALAYTCHVINKEYLIGYGRGHRSHFQNLPDIYRLNPERILKKYKTMPL